MYISEVKISNFKSFGENFSLKLDSKLNIIVGLNEAGKTSILEAIHLACSGIFNGKIIKSELSQNLFNRECINKYLESLKEDNPLPPPEISIEIFFEEVDDEYYKGDYNSYKDSSYNGFIFKIFFNDSYIHLYNALVKSDEEVISLPIEYYDVSWTTFARKPFLPRDLKFKSSLVDSSQVKTASGCDVHFTKILRDSLSDEDKIEISQAHRKLVDDFRKNPKVKELNTKLEEQAKISKKDIKISVELQTKNAWENSLTTLLDNIPYSFVGMGEQSIVKTNLALLSDKTKNASIVLIEEPENHLTFIKLNELIETIRENNSEKQIIITTHSSFVANKLGLQSLKILSNKNIIMLSDLKQDTYEFFEKIAGYDTLRFILSEKTILVEGDSDELIVQRSYMDNKHKLPIYDGIDVMSVGLSFLRFLEIAEKLKKKVSVVTDNDGNIDALKNKYINYIRDNKKPNINICYDDIVDPPYFELNDNEYFSFNTLETKIYKANNIDILNQIFGTHYEDEKSLLRYMRNNKTDNALKIFKSSQKINYPDCIVKSFKVFEDEE